MPERWCIYFVKTCQPSLESGTGGTYRTGVDSSANIVLDNDIYNDVTAKIIQTDALMEERLHGIVTQIEEMCGEVFIVPETTAKIQITLETVKSTMSEFRDLTTQISQIAKMYVSQMEEVDC